VYIIMIPVFEGGSSSLLFRDRLPLAGEQQGAAQEAEAALGGVVGGGPPMVRSTFGRATNQD
jgi:hypothetical protein